MKRTSPVTIALLLIAAHCFGQSADKSDYLQKSKNQKTAAFVLLGAGAALDFGGIIATFSNANKELDFPENGVNHSAEYALYIAGTACLMGSLTLFIIAKSNKQKALALGIETEQFHRLKKSGLYTVNYPALTLKIRF